MNIETASTTDLQEEWQRLYEVEAELAKSRKAIDRELGKRLRKSNLDEEVARAMMTLSPEAKSALIQGVAAEAAGIASSGRVGGN